jgi:hypothetical protein
MSLSFSGEASAQRHDSAQFKRTEYGRSDSLLPVTLSGFESRRECGGRPSVEASNEAVPQSSLQMQHKDVIGAFCQDGSLQKIKLSWGGSVCVSRPALGRRARGPEPEEVEVGIVELVATGGRSSTVRFTTTVTRLRYTDCMSQGMVRVG